MSDSRNTILHNFIGSIWCKIKPSSENTVLPSLDIIFNKNLIEQLEKNLNNSDFELIKNLLPKVKGYMESIVKNKKEEGSTAFPMPIDLSSLNKLQAFELLREINQENKLSGAVHIPSTQSILFQYKNIDFIIEYGKQLYHFPSLISFDKHKGFNTKNDYVKDSAIFLELQKAFLTYKKNNYQGQVIPAERAGFNIENDLKENNDNGLKSKM